MAEPFDIAVVGYGPTGATLANLLGLQGYRVAVFDREPAPLPLPRAVHFDGEVMRLFQTLGIASAMLPKVRPSGGMRYENTAGQVMIERKPAEGSGPHGWATNYLFHQPDLEDVLREGAARFPGVQVFLGTEVVSISQSDEGVLLQTPRGIFEARYAVGCDGARSLVRQAIGSEHEDLGLHQPWLVVDAVLERDDVALPEQTVQFCDPARPITFVKVTGRRRRWEIMLMPGDDPARMTEPSRVWPILERWIRPGDARLERSAVYTFHSLIARRWRHRRLLIAGDAAHQTPPFLGQGMCAGLRDAANLAWKFGNLRDNDALLDSYQSEREPHVRVFIEEALRLGGIIQTTDPEVAARRDRRFMETGKEEMVNLSPPLGPGLHDGTGQIHPQPRLADGRWLDEAIGGYRFAVLTREPVDLPPGVARVAHEAPESVVLRPDRYVFGRATGRAALQALVDRLPRQERAPARV